VPQLLAATTEPLRVFLLGAAPGVADEAADRIRQRWPKVEVVGTYSPPLGFENDSAENDRILAAIAAAEPDLLVIGFGAPKQELWVRRHRDRLEAKVAMCAGATIDFLAGHRRRSPVWPASRVASPAAMPATPGNSRSSSGASGVVVGQFRVVISLCEMKFLSRSERTAFFRRLTQCPWRRHYS
jgi:hypothetical protein